MVWIRQLVCFNHCPSQLHRVSGECIGMEHTEHEKAGGTCNFNKPRNENAGARTSITITSEQWQLRIQRNEERVAGSIIVIAKKDEAI